MTRPSPEQMPTATPAVVPSPAAIMRGQVTETAGARRGCPVSELKTRLRDAGLRPTRQRMALGWLLFGKGDRHITAEILFHEARDARAFLSLATVYNTLRQFTEVGLLREVATGGTKSWFDTNTGNHHHFLIEGEEKVVDFPAEQVKLSALPDPPPGFRIAGVDVVVRLVRESD